MYLRANEKVSGVVNFHTAVGSKLIRQALSEEALQKGLAPQHGMEAFGFKYEAPAKPLAVGLLGFGRQGQRLLKAATATFLAVKAIADLRPSNRKRAAELAKGARVVGSYADLLKSAKDDGLDAVIIALPSHLHASAALAAMELGLHVFIEPPMALTVADAKKIAAAAAEKKLCAAVGQQRRYNWIYDNALEMVRRDLLDQVHYVRSQWHLQKPGAGAADADEDGSKKGDAKGFQLDWWQEISKEDAGAKYEGYAGAEEAVRWPLYEKYSGGLLAELGSQLIDAAALAVRTSPNHDPKRPYPLSVAGSATQVFKNAPGDIDDHVHCVFEYAIQGYADDKDIPPKARKKIALQFDMIIGNEFDGYGEVVLGRKGSLVLESEQKPMLFYMADVDKKIRVAAKKDKPSEPVLELSKDGKYDEEAEALGRLAYAGADGGFVAELQHWAACCKSGAQPRCDANDGLYTTVLVVAAGQAVRSGKRIDFDPKWFDAASPETPDTL